MRAQFQKMLRNIIILLLGSALSGTILLILVFCLPTDKMKPHAAVSVADMLQKPDGDMVDDITTYIQANRESYTDSIMVQNAIEKIPGKNVFEHAMRMYHSDLLEDVWTPEDSLKAYCAGQDTDSMYLHEYARYWHGYLVYLKPLLLFFTWKQISVLGILLQLFLMFIIVGLSIQKKQPGVAAAMIIGFLFMKPLLILVSLTMTVCWIITLAALIFLLLKNDRLAEKKLYAEYFLIVGILTSYFDFLTYPVVTLGFPLCAFFLMNGQTGPVYPDGSLKEDNKPAIKIAIQKMIGYSICWGIGYAGMWAMKWIIADLTLHTGTIKDAVWSIIGRTEVIGGRSRFNGGFYVLSLNLREYDYMIYPVMAAIITAISLLFIITACRKRGTAAVLVSLIPYMLIFCIPFVWIIVVQHHSALHARFTFRILAVAVLAIGCMGIQALKKIKET